MKKFLRDLKISRPGLWFPTIWIYLVPFGNQQGYIDSPIFWFGLFFVTFPLNFLVYGCNDLNDYRADAINQRKGNFLFGAKVKREELNEIFKRILIIVSPFFIVLTILGGIRMFLLLSLLVLANIVYNFEPFRLKEKPPFEIVVQAAYVLTAFFSIELNNLPYMPWQTVVYLLLFAFQAHIAGEIMDIEPDREAGKKTTAVVLGRKKSKFLMLCLLLIESYLLYFWFDDWVLAGFLLFFSLWLLLDVFFIFKDRPYTKRQMILFGYAINVSALLSMVWILYSGKLVMVS